MAKIFRTVRTKNTSFHAEHLLNKSNLALSSKISILTIATLAGFYQDLTIIMNDALQSEITNYMLVIPLRASSGGGVKKNEECDWECCLA